MKNMKNVSNGMEGMVNSYMNMSTSYMNMSTKELKVLRMNTVTEIVKVNTMSDIGQLSLIDEELESVKILRQRLELIDYELKSRVFEIPYRLGTKIYFIMRDRYLGPFVAKEGRVFGYNLTETRDDNFKLVVNTKQYNGLDLNTVSDNIEDAEKLAEEWNEKIRKSGEIVED